MRSAITPIVRALLITGAALLLSAAPADAAEYRVVQCANAPHDFVVYNTSPGLYAEDKCGSIAALALRAVPGAFVPSQHSVAWMAAAPDGTTFTSWQASFHGGSGGNSGWLASARVCADVTCYFPLQHLFFGLENWGAPVLKQWTGAGATMLQFGLACSFGAANGCAIGGSPPGGDMFAPEMVLNDHYAPPSPQATAGSILGTGWQSGARPHTISFAASDRGGGVDRVVATLSAGSWVKAAPCARGPSGHYSRFVPCPLAFDGTIPIDLGVLADGRHDLWLTAVDAGGHHSAGGPYSVYVDNTAPAAPKDVAVLGDGGWHAQDGFGVRWSNPTAQHAPIIAAHWQLCAVGGACRVGNTRATNVSGFDGLVMGRSGVYLLRVWLEDAAGNQTVTNAASEVRLRLDTDRPRPVFEPRNVGDPTRVTVSVADDASGLASGSIEIRQAGDASWRPLATLVEGDRLVASVDDENLIAGRYELRARASDAAGNEASTDRDRAGEPVTLQLPIRVITTMKAGRWQSNIRRVAVRRKGRRTIVRRRVRHLQRRVVSASGRVVLIEGSLLSHQGEALADVDIQVHERSDGGITPVGSVRTDAKGRFRYQLRPHRNKVLRFRYGGSPHIRGVTAEVAVGVRATSTIRASDRFVLNGESVILRGRVRTRPVPPGGKLVEVQAFFRDRWRTFSTVRTDDRGHWVLPYQFGGTVGTVRYRFRVRLPAEGGYAFETGTSRVKVVAVRGL